MGPRGWTERPHPTSRWRRPRDRRKAAPAAPRSPATPTAAPPAARGRLMSPARAVAAPSYFRPPQPGRPSPPALYVPPAGVAPREPAATQRQGLDDRMPGRPVMGRVVGALRLAAPHVAAFRADPEVEPAAALLARLRARRRRLRHTVGAALRLPREQRHRASSPWLGLVASWNGHRGPPASESVRYRTLLAARYSVDPP